MASISPARNNSSRDRSDSWVISTSATDRSISARRPGSRSPPVTPADVAGPDAVLFLKEAPNPQGGGHLVLRHPHPPTHQVPRLSDPAFLGDVNGVVAEGPGRERRNGDEILVAAGGLNVTMWVDNDISPERLRRR
jgi:hypothetical protein